MLIKTIAQVPRQVFIHSVLAEGVGRDLQPSVILCKSGLCSGVPENKYVVTICIVARASFFPSQ